MVSTVYLAYALVQFSLLVAATRLFLRNPHWVLVPFLVNVIGLVYDNLAIGFGHLIGPGQTLMLLNYPRYIIHATTTSLFGLLALYLAQQAGVMWAKQRPIMIIFWCITLLALARGIYIDLIKLDMVPTLDMGTLRYANAAMTGAPIPEIAAILMLIVCGLGIAIQKRWPWLFLGSLTMFIMASFAAKVGIIANLGEIALVAGIVVTAYHFLEPSTMLQSGYAAGNS